MRAPLPTGAVTRDQIAAQATARVDPAAAQAIVAAQQATAPAMAAAGAPSTKSKKKSTYSSKGGGGGFVSQALTGNPVWGGPNKGYYDLIWTPRVWAAKDREKRKEWAMARALYETVDSYDGEIVTISQMGSDFKVAQLKKDPQFTNEKLLDILKRYEEVFEVIMDSTRGFVAKLQPGAQVALPDAEEALAAAISEAELMLPEKMRNPTNAKERMQALRIEVVHALHRRGGHAIGQELGQEHRIQKYKANVPQAKKLIDFIKLFPTNFDIRIDEQHQQTLTLISFDVDDTSMIDMVMLNKNMSSFSSGGYGPQRSQGGGSRPAPFPAGAQRPMGMGFALPVGQFALSAMGQALPQALPVGQSGMPNLLPSLGLQPASMTGFSDGIRR